MSTLWCNHPSPGYITFSLLQKRAPVPIRQPHLSTPSPDLGGLSVSFPSPPGYPLCSGACVSFSIWLPSLSTVFSRFIHVVMFISSLFFLWLNNVLLCVGTTVCLSIHPLMDIWVVSYLFVVWIHAFWVLVLVLLGGGGVYVCVFSRSEIAGAHGNSVGNSWRNRSPAVTEPFRITTSSVQGHSLSRGSPTLVTCCFLKAAIPILAGMKWCFIVVLISVSLLSSMFSIFHLHPSSMHSA